MEINNFIIFIIIILLSIVLYKSAKIFNYNKKEKENYNDYNTLVLGAGNSYNKIGSNVNTYNELKIEDCKGEWAQCTDTPNGECIRNYNISNPNYLGSNCMESNNATQFCTPDRGECDNNIYSNNGTSYDILKGKTLIHSKRVNIDDDPSIQNKENIIEKVLNISSEPNIENDKFIELMDIYNDSNSSINSNNNEFIGIILKRNSNNTTNFYPIFINDDSMLEITDDDNSSIFMKQEINCRGKWSPCTFTEGNNVDDIEQQKSERKYFINYGGRGDSLINNCPYNSDDTELCASWGSCVKNDDSNEREWEKEDICNQEGEDCMVGRNQNSIETPTTDGCQQEDICTINFPDECGTFLGSSISGEKGHPDINIGDSGKIVTFINNNPEGSNITTCDGYENGKFYKSKMVKHINSSEYVPLDCDPNNSDKLSNCICDNRDDHSIECTKEYDFYWGRDWRENENEGLDSLGNPLNKLHDITDSSGHCFAYVKNFEDSTAKWKEENPNLPHCPAHIDLYDSNNNRIGKKSVNQTYYMSSNSKIGEEEISDTGMIVDLIQEAENLGSASYNIRDENNELVNKGITKNKQFIKFQKRDNPYPNYSDSEYYGEICKELAQIYPEDCVTTTHRIGCKSGYMGHIDLTFRNSPEKYGGSCLTNKQISMDNRCIKKPNNSLSFLGFN